MYYDAKKVQQYKSYFDNFSYQQLYINEFYVLLVLITELLLDVLHKNSLPPTDKSSQVDVWLLKVDTNELKMKRIIVFWT